MCHAVAIVVVVKSINCISISGIQFKVETCLNTSVERLCHNAYPSWPSVVNVTVLPENLEVSVEEGRQELSFTLIRSGLTVRDVTVMVRTQPGTAQGTYSGELHCTIIVELRETSERACMLPLL